MDKPTTMQLVLECLLILIKYTATYADKCKLIPQLEDAIEEEKQIIDIFPIMEVDHVEEVLFSTPVGTGKRPCEGRGSCCEAHMEQDE